MDEERKGGKPCALPVRDCRKLLPWTPGPWFVELERASTSRGFCRIVGSKAKPNRSNLAHVMGLYIDNKNVEADANARLIAAAPDGYNIADRLVAHLRDDFRIPDAADEGWIVDTLGHALSGIYLDALAFLAKARGNLSNTRSGGTSDE